MYLPEQVKSVIAALEAAGHEAYAVGGCVRDALRGTEPKDYDVTTSALPPEIERVFAGERVIETGLKHGTVTVLIDAMPIEITTYRVDGGYSDHRHPDAVTFTSSLTDDLARRDFTMNAIAYSDRHGIADPFGGQSDIAAGVVRCVGDPDRRFQEDALRILRALRFASVLGFDIDPATAEAAFRNRALLRNVSAERTASELVKLLCGVNASAILTTYIDVLGEIIPEALPMKDFDQRNPHHIYDVLTHTAIAVSHTPPDPVLRLAALLHDIGKPDTFFTDAQGVGHFYGHGERSVELAAQILERLRFDNATKKQVLMLVREHDVLIDESEKAVRRALGRFTPKGFAQLMQLKRADNLAQNPVYSDRQAYYTRLETLADTILREEQCFTLKNLAVNGGDLLAAGMRPGKELGATLQRMLDAVIAGEVENTKSALMQWYHAIIR